MLREKRKSSIDKTKKSKISEIKKKMYKQEKGITLIALVITIVILIILATVTINAAFGEGGIIKKAQQAKELTENAAYQEQEKLNSLVDEYANIMAQDSEIQEPIVPEEPSEVEQAKNDQTVFDTKTPIQDEKGNTIVVPEGFKLAEDSY